MQLDDYVRTLIRRWYIPAALVTLAVLGAFLYNSAAGTNTAQATVNVPFSALVGWDSVIHGRALSERVAEQLDDGSTAEETKGQYGGGFRTNTGSLTPQYAIRASDDTGSRAVLLADTVVQEAIRLYEEDRQANVGYIIAAYQELIDTAEAEAVAARLDLDTFLIENNAYSLGARLSDQSILVASLRIQAQVLGIVDVDAKPFNESAELTQARAELDRLLGIEPEYGRLGLNVSLAEASVSRLEAEITTLEVSGSGYDLTLAAVEDQLTLDRARLDAAEQDLADFNAANEIENLPAAIGVQQGAVNALLLAEVAAAGNASTVQGALNSAEAALIDLQSMLPEFTRLSTEFANTAALVNVRDQQQLFFAQIPPTIDRIEVVTDAQLVSNLWWSFIRYAAAIMLAMFFSLLAIYVLVFFERSAPSVDELEREFGVPVITRVPRST